MMGFELDPQVEAALAPMFAAMAGTPLPAVGDVPTRRETLEPLLAAASTAQPMPEDVTMTDFQTVARDGPTILLRWYQKTGAARGSAALYLHGGGMILGHVSLFDGPVARYVAASGVPLLSVEYRLAPEHPHPTPIEDAYAGLRWLAEHASELGVNPRRLAVMGDSAGGGLAAGLALMARDRGGPVVTRQILIYPMLDDRNTTTDPELAPSAFWSYEDNITGWNAMLGEAAGGPDVSAYAAPARATDVAGLPAARRGRAAGHLPRRKPRIRQRTQPRWRARGIPPTSRRTTRVRPKRLRGRRRATRNRRPPTSPEIPVSTGRAGSHDNQTDTPGGHRRERRHFGDTTTSLLEKILQAERDGRALQRDEEPEDLAAVALFLASSDSDLVSGVGDPRRGRRVHALNTVKQQPSGALHDD